MKRIEQRLVELATLSSARLRAEWRTLNRGQMLTAGLTQTQLLRSVAWRMQEKVLGGLPTAAERELNRLAAQLAAGEELDLGHRNSLKPGSQLVRHWRNQANVVTVIHDGFEFEGRRYSSLTKIAKEITGTAWSGPRFFGLHRAPGTST